jgi:hypothetical protein
MNLNLTDRRVTTALAAIFLLGIACVLLLVLAVLTLCALLVNALIGTIAEAFTTVSTLYTSGGPLTHLIFLVGILFGIPFSFKRLRMPVLRFCQHQFARFTAFAQRQQRPSPAPDPIQEDEDQDDYEEGEVIEMDAEEDTHQARTTTAPPTSGKRATTGGKPRKQRKKQKRAHKTPTARAALALTHA